MVGADTMRWRSLSQISATTLISTTLEKGVSDKPLPDRFSPLLDSFACAHPRSDYGVHDMSVSAAKLVSSGLCEENLGVINVIAVPGRFFQLYSQT